ncbi:MAG: S26 family signal peptidase, partial [Pyrinomonadaceae bacterium]|nr:S26 family signal peptidase [Pyrinomonadaceae bacterium]
MLPTIKVNDTVIFEGISYKLGEIERGDIVIIKSPDEGLLEGGNGQEYFY